MQHDRRIDQSASAAFMRALPTGSASVSISRQATVMVGEEAKPWGKIGMSRATWYRHGKPTKPLTIKNVDEMAKFVGAPSTRSYQRMMRVLQSDLAGYVHAGVLSISQADRMLSDPEHLRRFHEVAAALAEASAAMSRRPR